MNTTTVAARLCGIAAALWLASCALPGAAPGTTGIAPIEAAAPQYRVGDRWVYRVQSGFRDPDVYEETHTVTATGAEGTTVRVAAKGPHLDVERVERWPAPGLVAQGALFDVETRRFATPLIRYRFPLQPRERWNQFVRNYNERTDRDGVINHYVQVAGYEKVTTSAGTFDAVRLNVIMRLDDEEFWRWPTDSNYTVWYAPAVKGPVRELKRASYLEKGSGHDSAARLPAQYAIVELVSFTPGA